MKESSSNCFGSAVVLEIGLGRKTFQRSWSDKEDAGFYFKTG